MAVLTVLPDPRTIAESKGIIDFYYWKGIPVARKWPAFTRTTFTDPEIQSQALFTLVAKATGAVSTQLADLYKALPQADGTTWVDLFRATYMGAGWFEDGN